MLGLILRIRAWNWWRTGSSGRRQCRHCMTSLTTKTWRRRRRRRMRIRAAGLPRGGLCSGDKLWGTTFHTVRSRPIESRVRLALGGPTTPTTALRLEALSSLIPEAAVESPAAGDENGGLSGFLNSYVFGLCQRECESFVDRSTSVYQAVWIV